ncbi:TetR/AcrR family transcriptional regulator [Pseudooceanicola sp.]|jgi:AcrR family transcriptional regulator|uniref:TetR/AcrR family transcriptional regulator n=1 Tax=Pseudooceanicola sp. TaxID=1914328 RepID=UPI004058E0D2
MNIASLRIHHAAMRIFAETGGTAIAVSELAKEAGLSRGTIYNNLENPADLFASVCDMMAEEFLQSVRDSFGVQEDPAQRVSNAIRLCVRRVQEEPHWGRFIARYAMIEPKLGAFWGRIPAEELRRGIDTGRFDIRPDQIVSICGMMGGATFGAMTLVLNGHRTWREAGSDTAETMLRGLGIARREARRLAQTEFEPLPRMALFDAA